MRKKKYKSNHEILNEGIKKFSNYFSLPKNNKFTNYETNSWFKIKESKQNNLFKNFNIIPDKYEHDGFFTRKIELYPNIDQIKILDIWFNSYIYMFNETTKYFKQQKFNKIKADLSITNLKKILQNKKKEIINKSEIKINNKKIYATSHMLDYAINDALKRYKTCISNKKNGNINYFRLRYLKLTKESKIFVLEKEAFTNNGFCINSLGKMRCSISNYDYTQRMVTTSIIKYEKGGYYLLKKEFVNDNKKVEKKYKKKETNDTENFENIKETKKNKIKKIKDIEKETKKKEEKGKKEEKEKRDKKKEDKLEEKLENKMYIFKKPILKTTKDNSKNKEYIEKEDMIIIDPGIRTLITGYSNNNYVKGGTNVYKIISEKLKKMDKIETDIKMEKSKKKYKKNRILRKIKNMVNDCHYKMINYLTKEYESIIFGNLSTKKIGENERLNKMVKRVGNMIRLYEFKERLKYRCVYTNTKYKEVNESYTSKSCSKCGNYKKDLGGNKIYKCEKCGIEMDRDLNGAINIGILARMK